MLFILQVSILSEQIFFCGFHTYTRRSGVNGVTNFLWYSNRASLSSPIFIASYRWQQPTAKLPAYCKVGPLIFKPISLSFE